MHFVVTPTHLLTLATLPFALSFVSRTLNLAALVALFTYLLFGVVGGVSEWVGVAQASPWHIKLHLTTMGYGWALALTFLTTLHVLSCPDRRRFSSAFCLAGIGVAVASDLFHAYVWLEVATFALMGFGAGDRALREYWGLQTFAAFLVLVGAVLQYQLCGTLTMPEVMRSSGALYVWMIGWLVKSGVGMWLLRGYRTFDHRDLCYIVALGTKLGLLVLYRLPEVPDWIRYLGLGQYVIGALIAYSARDQRTFLGGHAIAHCGSLLSALQHGPIFERYFVLHVLADALFVDMLISQKEGEWSIWWIVAIACVAGIPPSATYFLKVRMLEDTWWLALSGVGTLAYCLQQGEGRAVQTPRGWALVVAVLLANVVTVGLMAG